MTLFTIVGNGWDAWVVPDKCRVSGDLKSQAGYTLLSKKPVVVSDLDSEARFTGPDLLEKHSVKSGISVTIFGRNEQVYGVIGVHSKTRQIFTKDDVDYVQSVANILSLSVQRHQIDTERRKYEQQKDEFIAVASHELKTPVTSIKAFGHVLGTMFQAERKPKGENGSRETQQPS
jgi:GAF domain-containing protein